MSPGMSAPTHTYAQILTYTAFDFHYRLFGINCVFSLCVYSDRFAYCTVYTVRVTYALHMNACMST